MFWGKGFLLSVFLLSFAHAGLTMDRPCVLVDGVILDIDDYKTVFCYLDQLKLIGVLELSGWCGRVLEAWKLDNDLRVIIKRVVFDQMGDFNFKGFLEINIRHTRAFGFLPIWWFELFEGVEEFSLDMSGIPVDGALEYLGKRSGPSLRVISFSGRDSFIMSFKSFEGFSQIENVTICLHKNFDMCSLDMLPKTIRHMKIKCYTHQEDNLVSFLLTRPGLNWVVIGDHREYSSKQHDFFPLEILPIQLDAEKPQGCCGGICDCVCSCLRNCLGCQDDSE